MATKVVTITEEYFANVVKKAEAKKPARILAQTDAFIGMNWRAEKKCPLCKKDLIGTTLKNEKSEAEIVLSGMCQACQDRMFDSESESESEDEDEDEDEEIDCNN